MIFDLILFIALWLWLGFVPAVVLMVIFLVLGALIPREKSVQERLAFPLF